MLILASTFLILTAADYKADKRIYFTRLGIAVIDLTSVLIIVLITESSQTSAPLFLFLLEMISKILLMTLSGREVIKCLKKEYSWTFAQINKIHLVVYTLLFTIVYLLSIYSITAKVEIKRQKALGQFYEENGREKVGKLKEELKWKSDFLSDYQDKEKIWKAERDSMQGRIYELEMKAKYRR